MLLGPDSGKTVNVANSFGTSFEDDEIHHENDSKMVVFGP